MEITLQAEPRRVLGSRAVRRMRREAKVPAVLYGREVAATPVAVDARDLASALHTEAGLNVLINLELDGEQHLTLPREVQRHPTRDEILHLDFVRVSRTEKVEAEVPIHLEGEPGPAKEGLGVIEQIRGIVRVEALPGDLPPHVSLEIRGMELGQVLRIEDLPTLAGVEYLDDPEDPVVTLAVPRMEVPEEEEELVEELEGEELPEGEEPPEEAEEPPEEEEPED